MQYWVNINGKQSGPINRQQLAEMVTDAKNTYVWYQGLENWLPITEVADLADIVEAAGSKSAADAVAQSSADDAPCLADGSACQQPSDVVAPETPADNQPAEDAEPTCCQPNTQANISRPVNMPEPPKENTFQHAAYSQQQPATGNPQQKLPPTNLVWAILATILCCQFTGIVAIIFSIKTSQYINLGNLDLAQKFSDKAAIWIIASIIVGILYTPVAMISSLL